MLGEVDHQEDEFLINGEELVFLGVALVHGRVDGQQNQHRHEGNAIVGLEGDQGDTG